MKKHIAAFASITYANKAKAALARNGINARVSRTPRTLAGGCGYSVTAECSAERLKRILEENGISCKSISEASEK